MSWAEPQYKTATQIKGFSQHWLATLYPKVPRRGKISVASPVLHFEDTSTFFMKSNTTVIKSMKFETVFLTWYLDYDERVYQ